MDMTDMKPEVLLHVLNPQFDAAVHCRYGDAFLRAGLPRIFTTNTTMIGRDTFVPQGRNADQIEAIQRRLHIVYITVHITVPLFFKRQEPPSSFARDVD